MKNVVAIVITYNIGERFKKTILSLQNQVDEIVVVDNGSKKSTEDMLISLKDKITLIRLTGNKGIAYALNIGIKYCLKKEYKWILTLDHDSILSYNMVNEMLRLHDGLDEKEQKKIAMITPIHIEEKEVKDYFTIEKGYKEILTEITSGSLVKGCIYRDLGTYDEKLFIDLVDHDYCLFLNKNGYKIIQVKSAVLIHNLGASTRNKLFGINLVCTNHNHIRRYYMTRNRFYIWNKYKKDFRFWVIKDKRRFLSEIIKILLFETNKKQKLKFIYYGIKDYNHKIFYDCKMTRR